MATIGGSVVGGIAVIAIVVLRMSYLWRRHLMTPSATFLSESQLESQQHNEARRPPPHDRTQESSTPKVSRPMKVYVRVLVHSSCLGVLT